MQLLDLNLSHNMLEEIIPSQMGYISTLETLDLSNNRLTGQTPQQLGHLPSIETMNLSRNELSVRKIHQHEPNSGVLDIPLRFENETDVLTKLRHRNIVKLYGYCSHARHTSLVYEFLGGGSLYEILITDEKAMELQWIKRMNIRKDVSKAISYMHNDFFPSIVHRDISSKNILLDSKQNAHVSDFGTAKFLRLDSSNWTPFHGTYGYAAPELAYITEVNAKSDVYSFGMLALKVIMGKHPEKLIDFLLATEKKVEEAHNCKNDVAKGSTSGSSNSLPVHGADKKPRLNFPEVDDSLNENMIEERRHVLIVSLSPANNILEQQSSSDKTLLMW
ncbi:hypothetical protein ACH5RR_034037 [Cinchona calisaya]|uniref:non-specific serine/threonine protein kinase n=1 Tax=Cinchona calisaya TaxID=153742 RepID=A0ABD2YB02_9GENT